MNNYNTNIEIHVFATGNPNDCLRMVNKKNDTIIPINGINSTFSVEQFIAKEEVFHRLAVNDSFAIDHALLFMS